MWDIALLDIDRQFDSFVHQQELKKVKSEIKGRKVSVIIDTTPRLVKAMVIIITLLMKSGQFSNEWLLLWRTNCRELLFVYTPSTVCSS